MIASSSGGPVWAAILIAVIPAFITGMGAVLVVVLQNRKTRTQFAEARQENTDQHGTNVDRLDTLIASQNRLEGKVDGLAGTIDRVDTKQDLLAERVAVIEVNGANDVMGHSRRIELTVEQIDNPPAT